VCTPVKCVCVCVCVACRAPKCTVCACEPALVIVHHSPPLKQLRLQLIGLHERTGGAMRKRNESNVRRTTRRASHAARYIMQGGIFDRASTFMDTEIKAFSSDKDVEPTSF